MDDEGTVWGENVDELLDLMVNHRTIDAKQPDDEMLHFTITSPQGRYGLVRALMRAEAALLVMDADAADESILARSPAQRAMDAFVLVARDCARARGADFPILPVGHLPD